MPGHSFLDIPGGYHYTQVMKKVLLINPDTTSLARYSTILDRDDIEIFTATTARDALSIHHLEQVDLLLVLLNLPDMGGDELCVRIRQEQVLRKVSVIIICRDKPEEIARVENCGANACLVRPFKLAQLDECVGTLLAVRERHDCRVLVRVQLFDEQGSAALLGTTANISVSGLMVKSDEHLEVGARVSCMFLLPSSSRITTIGEVVRTTRKSRGLNEYGIRFISLDPRSREEIEQFIAAKVGCGTDLEL